MTVSRFVYVIHLATTPEKLWHALARRLGKDTRRTRHASLDQPA